MTKRWVMSEPVVSFHMNLILWLCWNNLWELFQCRDGCGVRYIKTTILIIYAFVIFVNCPILWLYLLFQMIIMEGIHFSVCRPKMGKTTNTRAYIHVLYRTIGVFAFGAAVSQLTTDITKYSVGRLRPHYLTICNPNITCTNVNHYIEEDVCLGTDLAKLKEAR